MAYIDREIAIKTAVENYKCNNHIDAVNLVEAMENIPSADVVEVKHGVWIKSIYKEPPIIKDGRLFERAHEVFCCSLCNVKIVGLKHMTFCPFCGAKMDGERKDADGKD